MEALKIVLCARKIEPLYITSSADWHIQLACQFLVVDNSLMKAVPSYVPPPPILPLYTSKNINSV